jgi:hypothetical protein
MPGNLGGIPPAAESHTTNLASPTVMWPYDGVTVDWARERSLSGSQFSVTRLHDHQTQSVNTAAFMATYLSCSTSFWGRVVGGCLSRVLRYCHWCRRGWLLNRACHCQATHAATSLGLSPETTGKQTWKLVPSPTLDSIWKSPPMARTNCSTTARPIPRRAL